MQTAYLRTNKLKVRLPETATEPLTGFLSWWYKTVPSAWLDVFIATFTLLLDKLSITLLLTTFFTPWHRDRTVVGRSFGVVMRLLYLPLTFIALSLIMAPFIAFLIVWLMLPFSPLLVATYHLIFR